MRVEPFLVAALLLAFALPATAQDGWPSGDLRWPIPLAGQAPATGASSDEADAEERAERAEREGAILDSTSREARDQRHFRIELTGRLVYLAAGKFKDGVGDLAHRVYPRRDLHMPGTPTLGYRLLFDVQVNDWLLIGAYGTHVRMRAPRRTVHHKGVGSAPETIPGYTRGRSSLDLFVGEVFFRYIVLDSDRFQFSIGIGAAAMSYRFRWDGPGRRMSARIDNFYAPTLNYLIQFRVNGPFFLYLESSTGLISPARFFSYHSEFRAGLRYAIGGGFEWILAISSLSGLVQDLRELYGRHPTSGHRYKQAAYTILGVETGFAFRF